MSGLASKMAAATRRDEEFLAEAAELAAQDAAFDSRAVSKDHASISSSLSSRTNSYGRPGYTVSFEKQKHKAVALAPQEEVAKREARLHAKLKDETAELRFELGLVNADASEVGHTGQASITSMRSNDYDGDTSMNYMITGTSMTSSSSSSARPASAPSGTGARGKALWKKLSQTVNNPSSPLRGKANESLRDLICFEEHIAIVEAEEAERSHQRDKADR